MTNERQFEDQRPTHEMRRKIVRRAAGGVAAIALLAVGNEMTHSAPDAPRTTVPGHHVQEGETLSDIAQNVCIDKTVAYPILEDRIVDLRIANNLSTDQVHAGQILKVPEDICE